MRQLRPGFVLLLASLAVAGCDRAEASSLSSAPGARDAAGPLVVVELFSSEGCSSCPPAEALARRLDDEAQARGLAVSVLEAHVDYWNRLGWVDPFASPAWTARQREYAAALGGGSYTPEVVVDGSVHEVGSREAAVRARIAEARGRRHLDVRLRREGEALVVTLPAVAEIDEPVHAFAAFAERGLTSRVAAGENAGRVLAHGPILRELRDLGLTGDAPRELKTKLAERRGPVTVFLQGTRTRRIYGAAKL